MSPEDKAKAIAKAERRLERARAQSLDVPYEIFLISKMGFYYGWPAVETMKRGYITYHEENDKGELILKKSPFTLEEASALMDGADKVWNSKVIDMSHGNFIAHRSAMVKEQGKEFNEGMKPFIEKAS